MYIKVDFAGSEKISVIMLTLSDWNISIRCRKFHARSKSFSRIRIRVLITSRKWKWEIFASVIRNHCLLHTVLFIRFIIISTRIAIPIIFHNSKCNRGYLKLCFGLGSATFPIIPSVGERKFCFSLCLMRLQNIEIIYNVQLCNASWKSK